MKWKDETTFSRNDTDRTPRVWSAKVGRFAVSVHRHIHYEQDVWLLSTNPDLFENYRLCYTDIEEAKAQALHLLRSACQDTIKVIDANN